jgi:hypothetical protein
MCFLKRATDMFPAASRLVMGPNQAPSFGVKQPEHEADHSPPSTANSMNGGAILPLPIHLHGTVSN